MHMTLSQDSQALEDDLGDSVSVAGINDSQEMGLDCYHGGHHLEQWHVS